MKITNEEISTLLIRRNFQSRAYYKPFFLPDRAVSSLMLIIKSKKKAVFAIFAKLKKTIVSLISPCLKVRYDFGKKLSTASSLANIFMSFLNLDLEKNKLRICRQGSLRSIYELFLGLTIWNKSLL